MSTIAEILSDFTLSVRYEDIPEKTLHEVKRRIIDSLGCAMGAYRSKPARIARKMGKHFESRRGATILGTGIRTSPDYAAFANGLLVRYLDYNDTYLSLEPAHPSDNFSAALAVAEVESASGKSLLAALLIAYEIQCRLCDQASLRARGWDHVVYGLFSSSMAAGKLLRLSREQLVHALGMAGVAHIALRQTRIGALSMWKGAAFANAARNGVFSAHLAGHGMTGPAPIFEGEKGIFSQVSGPIRLSAAEFGGKAKPFRIMDSYIKFYPAEYHSQSAISASLELRPDIMAAGGIGEIASVLVKTPLASYEIIGSEKEKWAPGSRETADHSLPYVVGIALIDGKVGLDQFNEKRYSDRNVLSFLRKIEIVRDEALDREYPAGIPNEVAIRLNSGKVFSRKILYPKGHPGNPLSDSEVEAKFKTLSKGVIPRPKADEILETVWKVEKLKDCGALPRLMNFSKGDE